MERKEYDPQIFAGTASYYSLYRRGYPRELFDYLMSRFCVESGDSCLDLGCGTGQLAIPLAQRGIKVIAMDPDQDMLIRLQRSSADLGDDVSGRIKRICGTSWDLVEYDFKVNFATMGESFHWMDRAATLTELSKKILGGGVAVISKRINHDPTIKEILDATIASFLGSKRLAGSGFYSHPIRTHEDVLRASEFVGYSEEHFRYTESWTKEAYLGFLYSTSYASRRLLGDRVHDFEHELLRRLDDAMSDNKSDVAIDVVSYTALTK